MRESIFFTTLYYTFRRFDFPFEKTGFSDIDLIGFQKSFKNKKIPKKVLTFEYHFIKELFKEYYDGKNPKYHKAARRHYASLLREAYEQRNFYQHQAISNQKSIIKLQYTLPWIVQRFRWAIFDEIKKHKEISFSMAIDNLVKKGYRISK